MIDLYNQKTLISFPDINSQVVNLNSYTSPIFSTSPFSVPKQDFKNELLPKQLFITNFFDTSKNIENYLNTFSFNSIYENKDKLSTSTSEIFEQQSTETFSENKVNLKRISKLKNEFSVKLLYLIKEQVFEYGYESPADVLVKNLLAENEAVTKQWLNDLFITNFAVEWITTGLLRVISHLEYKEIAPEGPTMALAALVNKSSEVQECGIRAFENWGTRDSLKILRSVKCTEKWLNDYLNQVISDLTKEFSV